MVRLEDESGVVGFGSAEDCTGAAAKMVSSHFARILADWRVDDTEGLPDALYRASIAYGRKGAALEAISAIDIALWDLKGRRCGKPVFEILGGDARTKIPVYASKVFHTDGRGYTEDSVREYVAQGYRALKIHFPCGPQDGTQGMDENIKIVDMARRVAGKSVALMTDAYMGWTYEYALKMSELLECYGLEWIEEPFLPDEYESYVKLSHRSKIPIAAGEHEFSRYGFSELVGRRCVSVVQPDVHRCGGLTESRAICSIANSQGVSITPHVLTPATAHLCLSQPGITWAENLVVPSWATSNAPLREPLFTGGYSVVNGFLQVDSQPGLGAECNTELLSHAEVVL